MADPISFRYEGGSVVVFYALGSEGKKINAQILPLGEKLGRFLARANAKRTLRFHPQDISTFPINTKEGVAIQREARNGLFLLVDMGAERIGGLLTLTKTDSSDLEKLKMLIARAITPAEEQPPELKDSYENGDSSRGVVRVISRPSPKPIDYRKVELPLVDVDVAEMKRIEKVMRAASRPNTTKEEATEKAMSMPTVGIPPETVMGNVASCRAYLNEVQTAMKSGEIHSLYLSPITRKHFGLEVGSTSSTTRHKWLLDEGWLVYLGGIKSHARYSFGPKAIAALGTKEVVKAPSPPTVSSGQVQAPPQQTASAQMLTIEPGGVREVSLGSLPPSLMPLAELLNIGTKLGKLLKKRRKTEEKIAKLEAKRNEIISKLKADGFTV